MMNRMDVACELSDEISTGLVTEKLKSIPTDIVQQALLLCAAKEMLSNWREIMPVLTDEQCEESVRRLMVAFNREAMKVCVSLGVPVGKYDPKSDTITDFEPN